MSEAELLLHTPDPEYHFLHALKAHGLSIDTAEDAESLAAVVARVLRRARYA